MAKPHLNKNSKIANLNQAHLHHGVVHLILFSKWGIFQPSQADHKSILGALLEDMLVQAFLRVSATDSDPDTQLDGILHYATTKP